MLKRTLLSAAVASALFAGVANAAGVVAIATSPTLEANSPGATEQYGPGQANYMVPTMRVWAPYGSASIRMCSTRRVEPCLVSPVATR